MSITAQSAVFSMAVQPSGRNGSDTNIDPTALEWYRTRAPRIGVGSVQLQEQFPLETGGPIVPTGSFKSGQYAQGDVEMILRAEEFLGYLLYGATGVAEQAVDSVYDPSTDTLDSLTYTGVNVTRFKFDPLAIQMPWMGIRTFVPGQQASENYGEICQDTRINALSMNIPAAGLVGATVGFQSLKCFYPTATDVNAWAYQNATEDSLSAPHAGKGQFLIGGTQYPITSASIELVNNMSTPQQEMVVGSYHPDNAVPLSRQLQVRIVYKWENADFYKQVMAGGVNNVNWDSLPFKTETSGGTKGFETTFQSPGNIPGVTGGDLPFELKVIANRVTWQVDQAGIQLQAGNIIQVPYVGIVEEPAVGQDYLEFIVQNAATYGFASVWS